MLSFFRRIINSKLGVVVTLGVLAVIALAFAAGDVTGLRSSGTGGLTGSNVAKVGGEALTTAELRSRVQNEFDGIRQQNPNVDISQFVAQGGLDGTLDRIVTGLSLERFGVAQGMVVSKRSVDGQIASIPGLQGPNGKFDPAIYQRLLAERKLTDALVRTDIARQTFAQQLTLPLVGATQVPQQLALPYASLLLEKRKGQVAFVPVAAMSAGATPTGTEIAAFYARNLARYTVPERRVVRYAAVTPETVKARSTPTDADIAAAYNADRQRFAPTQKRTVDSVVAADLATATALAAKAKSGGSLADAARAAGLEAATRTGVTRSAYAAASSAAIADAVFATTTNMIVGPLKAPLGWTVARVTAIDNVAGRSLTEARGDLTGEVAKRKTAEALGALHDAMDDALGKNATFEEAVTDQKLQPVTTPPLLANGTDPAAPDKRPDPVLAAVLAAAFQSEEGDDPQLVQTGAEGGFAIVALTRIVRAAPRPLGEVREAVARDFAQDRARQATRRVANAITAQVNKGTPLARAIAAAGVPLPGARPLAASRAQIAANPRAAPAPLVLMFSMVRGNAKVIEAPQGDGWMVVELDRIERGDATRSPGVVAAARADLGRGIGREYVEQFARAVRADVGVKIDAAAVARVKADLIGAGGGGTN